MKLRWIVAMIAVFATGGVTGCGDGSDAAETSPPPVVAVRVRGVETRIFTDIVTASGQWRSTGEAAVTAPFAAVVDSLGVQLGDRVAAGQVLCHLVTREAQAAQRGAALMAAEAHDPVSRAEAERAAALARRDRVPIPLVAPRSGVVIRVSVVAGSEVAESGEILTLLPIDAMVFEARLSPADAPRVRSGQNGSVVEEGRPSRPVVVQAILPLVGEGDQSVLAWLRPATGDGAPAIGRFGTASIEVGPARPAQAVPDSAVVQDDLTGESRVAVISATGRACWTPVTLGAGDHGWHRLIEPPLASGTLVITDGHRGLPDSTLIKVVG
jgi:multidrug efflux pump subunit AcrA (membrane-fusion protein)